MQTMTDLPKEKSRFFEISRWNGPYSIRVKIGGLFFGGSVYAAFIIYNGKPCNFQLQTWRPQVVPA